MLVLSRRIDESIVFPQLDIEISIVHLTHSQVRVRIKAPRKIKVLRGEIAKPKNAKHFSGFAEPSTQQAKEFLPTSNLYFARTTAESQCLNKAAQHQPTRCKTRIPMTEAQKRAYALEKQAAENKELAQRGLVTREKKQITTRDAAANSIALHQKSDGQNYTDRTRQLLLPQRIAKSDSRATLMKRISEPDPFKRKVTESRSKLANAHSVLNVNQEFETVNRVAEIITKLRWRCIATRR